MKDTLEFIVKSIVDNDKDVEVAEEEQDGIVNLTIKLNTADMGKIIGKEGKVIKAIRNVMRIPAVIKGKKIYINLAEV